MRGFRVIACAVCAVAAFGFALRTYSDVSMFGFPDGYVTDYQRAATTPLKVFGWAGVLLGIVFVALAFSPRDGRRHTVAWTIAFVALLLVAATVFFGVPWYFGTHLGLDDGIGG